MRKLTLEKLKCYETEDWAGADECRLEVYADGAFQPPTLRKTLNDGESWSLNRSCTFKNKVEVRLWDEDSPGADDFLGRANISTSLRSHATVPVTGDDVNYKLWYTVVDLTEPEGNPVEKAVA